jgi:hypothetical protein
MVKKKPKEGDKFRLYGYGPWCQITSVSDNKARFVMLNQSKITGSFPLTEWPSVKYTAVFCSE